MKSFNTYIRVMVITILVFTIASCINMTEESVVFFTGKWISNPEGMSITFDGALYSIKTDPGGITQSEGTFTASSAIIRLIPSTIPNTSGSLSVMGAAAPMGSYTENPPEILIDGILFKPE
jgi:hypothetical protein